MSSSSIDTSFNVNTVEGLKKDNDLSHIHI